MNIKDMTNEQKSHFWALFTNDHPIISYDVNGEGSLSMRNYYADLSGFQIVKEYMESKWPMLWERYLDDCFTTPIASDIFNAQLSLDNLLSFLMENTEMWGWEECEYMKEWPRILPNGGSAFFCEKQCKDKPINCNGGKVKHPALLYAEGL
jgi:hypothetical protein